METRGIVPAAGFVFRMGDVPDQYGRAGKGDDGEGEPPVEPGQRDLPLRIGWDRRDGRSKALPLFPSSQPDGPAANLEVIRVTETTADQVFDLSQTRWRENSLCAALA